MNDVIPFNKRHTDHSKAEIKPPPVKKDSLDDYFTFLEESKSKGRKGLNRREIRFIRNCLAPLIETRPLPRCAIDAVLEECGYAPKPSAIETAVKEKNIWEKGGVAIRDFDFETAYAKFTSPENTWVSGRVINLTSGKSEIKKDSEAEGVPPSLHNAEMHFFLLLRMYRCSQVLTE